MAENKKDAARRTLLKKLAVGGGIVTATQVMPERWSKPVIDSVVLPAHAGTSESENSTDNPGWQILQPVKPIENT